MSANSGIFEDKTGLERIQFFSDAVMAIAITLLVIDLRVPENAQESSLGGTLLKLWPNYLGYLLSFFVIGNYWLSHHRLFRPIRRYDDRLRWLSLGFLFFIALLPFSTRLIGLFPFSRTAIAIYSLNVLPLGFISFALTRHAYANNRLVNTSMPAADIRKLLGFSRRGTVVFMACLVISTIFPVAFFPVWFLAFLARSAGRKAFKIQ